MLAGVPDHNMKPSEYADAIFHADLFRIGGRGWLIGGNGRSRAAALASGSDPAADLARDTVAIIREGDRLLARFDPGAVPPDPVECDRRHPLHRLDFLAYCLSEAETAQAYAARPLAIAPVDNKMLAWMLTGQIYPAHLAPLYFEPMQISRLINRNLRVARFLELTEGVARTQFLVVPWMPTVEAKAGLYAGYAQADRGSAGIVKGGQAAPSRQPDLTDG